MPTQDPLVSTDWLEARLAAPDVKLADATWFLPTMRRDARAEYATAHLPGAVFFDIDDIVDEASPLPQCSPPRSAHVSHGVATASAARPKLRRTLHAHLVGVRRGVCKRRSD